ncbi:hypothetical protein Tco_1276505, partial [Tanacetum coccineum]
VEGYRVGVEWGKVRVSCGRYLRGGLGLKQWGEVVRFLAVKLLWYSYG